MLWFVPAQFARRLFQELMAKSSNAFFSKTTSHEKTVASFAPISEAILLLVIKMRHECYTTALVYFQSIFKLKRFVFCRWSFGIVLWEIVTLGKQYYAVLSLVFICGKRLQNSKIPVFRR